MKTPLRYHNRQLKGVFLIAVVMAGIVAARYLYTPGTNEQSLIEPMPEVIARLDSITAAKAEASRYKLRPFNPNYISEKKSYQLGMTADEYLRLKRFRESDKWANSKADFQRVTGVSDAWMDSISPLFKFPEWVTSPSKSKFKNYGPRKPKSLPESQRADINTATVEELQVVSGIGPALSARIVKERERLGGFQGKIQLNQVYGLEPDVIDKLWLLFTIRSVPFPEKINLATADQYELEKIPFIPFRLANRIVRERTLREGFKSWEELSLVPEFPANQLETVKLYLKLN